MSQRQEHLDLLIEELERYGLRGEISERGKHLEVAWNAPAGRRFVIAPKTPSDWRSGLNTRSELRKLLRADNLQPKQINELSFQKAMSLPKPTIAPQLMLQKDVDALVEMVFEMQAQIVAVSEQNTILQDKMNSITVVSRIEFAGQTKSEDADILLEVSRKLYDNVVKETSVKERPFREGSAQDKIYSCLTEQFQSVHKIVDQSGVNLKYVATTLSKAKRLGFAELGLRGMWRRK
jgi:hypothetical protein